MAELFRDLPHAEYVVSGDAAISTALFKILNRSTFLLCFPSASEEALRVMMTRMSRRKLSAQDRLVRFVFSPDSFCEIPQENTIKILPSYGYSRIFISKGADGVYPFIACLSRLTIDRVPSSRHRILCSRCTT